MAMDYCEKLKHYLDDFDEGGDIIGEAIASLEGHFELIPENELLHFSRVDAVAYLALKSIVRCKNCKHSEHWYGDKSRCFLWHDSGIDVFDNGFCNYGELKE